MLNAPTETNAAPRIAPRQPPPRDTQQAAGGFSSFVDDSAAAKSDRSRAPLPRETDTASRAQISRRTRDSREQDERTPRDTDGATSSNDASAPEQTAIGKPDAPTVKPAKKAGDTLDGQLKDQPAPPTADATAFDPTLALPNVVTTAEPVAVAVPVVVAPPSAPVVTATAPAPLSIAAAGLAAAKIVAAKTSDASKSDDAPVQPTAPASEEAVSPQTTGENTKTAAIAQTASVKVETGFAKIAAPTALTAETADAPASAAKKADPKPASVEAAPKDAAAAAADDATPASVTPAQPHDHRTAAAAAPPPDTAPNGQPPVTQPPAIHGSAAPTASPTAQLTATVAPNTPVPLNGLAVELAARAQRGSSRFEIRLDPAELGRIDVRIDIDRQGQVTSHLTVEKPETLAMLRQDLPQLQRALNDAGLKTADGALQFALGDQSQPHRNTDNGERQAQRFIVRDDETVAPAPPLRGYGRMFAARSGVDISV